MKKQKKQEKQSLPFLFLAVGGLLLVVVAFMLSSQVGTRQPAALTSVSGGHEEETYSEIERVSVVEAKAAFDSGTAVFVDVRGDQAYAAAHITGSVTLPLGEIETRLGELDSDQWIITYCT